MEVGNLLVKIGLNDQEFNQKLTQAQANLSQFGNNVFQEFNKFNHELFQQNILVENPALLEKTTAFGNLLGKTFTTSIATQLPIGFENIQTILLANLQNTLSIATTQTLQFSQVGKNIIHHIQHGVTQYANELSTSVIQAVQNAINKANALLASANINISNAALPHTKKSKVGSITNNNTSSNKSKTKTTNNTYAVTFDFKNTTLTTDELEKTWTKLIRETPNLG